MLGSRPSLRLDGARGRPVSRKRLRRHEPPFSTRQLWRVWSSYVQQRDPSNFDKAQSNRAAPPHDLPDRALAERDLDASSRLLLGFLPFHADRSVPDASLGDLIKQKPRIFLGECLQEERYDLVAAFFRRFPPDRRLFGAVLTQCLKQRQYENVCRLMELQSSLGLVPDAYDYNAYISALSRLDRLHQARSVFHDAVEAGHGTIYVFNTMLDAYARVGDKDQAEEIWQKLQEGEMEPDAVSYVGILRAAANVGDFDQFRLLYSELRSKDIRPMPHTFTVLFDAVTKTGAKLDVTWLMKMVQSIDEADVGMNAHIVSSMVNAFSIQKLTSDQMEFVFATVHAFRLERSPGNGVYSTLINFCCRQGVPQRAVDIWHMIKEDGFLPNGHVYSAVLKACWEMKLHQRGLRFAHEVAKRLRSDWAKRPDKTGSSTEMLPAFNALLHFYVETADAVGALATFHSMKRHGPVPDQITYNTVLSALDGAELATERQQVLESMKASGLAPDAQTYGILLNGCAEQRKVAEAVSLVREMQEAGLNPTVECYTSVMDVCVKEGSAASLSLAVEWFDRMKHHNLQPTAVTYGCMFLLHQVRGDVDGAFALYQEACACGVSPSDRCHNILISMCTEAGRLDDALELIKVLVRKHGCIAEDTMNSVTRALAQEYLPRSLVLLRLMHNRKMVPSSETLSCLILACCRESNVQMAFVLYKEMVAERMLVSRDVGSALIRSLSKAGQVLSGLRVTNDMFEKAGLPSIDASVIQKGQKPAPSRRKERILYSSLPAVQSLGFLIVALVQKRQLGTGVYVFRQICVLNDAAGVLLLVKDVRQVFGLLIEASCAKRRVDWAVEVFLKWTIANEKIAKMAERQKKPPRFPGISLASLAYLHATCKRTPGYESYIWPVCQAMQQQKDLSNRSLSPQS